MHKQNEISFFRQVYSQFTSLVSQIHSGCPVMLSQTENHIVPKVSRSNWVVTRMMFSWGDMRKKGEI